MAQKSLSKEAVRNECVKPKKKVTINDKEKGSLPDNKPNAKFYCNCGNGGLFSNDQSHIKCHKHKSAMNINMYSVSISNDLNANQKRSIDAFLKNSKSTKYEDYVKIICESGNTSSRNNIISELGYKKYLEEKLRL